MADMEGSAAVGGSRIGYSTASNTSPLRAVLFYSFMILLLPLFMYYFSKNYIFEGMLQVGGKKQCILWSNRSSGDRTCCSCDFHLSSFH
ncbi:uncharacterized protein [Amphiura filiformis]|uniref:uncharacterized protein n=1 Tax=Amphiura filiformis TaxID=82378 RepID=UPI003B212D19